MKYYPTGASGAGVKGYLKVDITVLGKGKTINAQLDARGNAKIRKYCMSSLH